MHFKAMLLALLVTAIWGCNFVSIKFGVMEMPALAILGLRYGITGLLFIPFMKWPGLKQAAMITSVGILIGLLHQGLLYLGLAVMPSGLMSILMQSVVIFSTLIGWLVFKETIGWRTWTGIAIGILGVSVLIGVPQDLSLPVLGFVFAISSAVFSALGNVMIKKVGSVHPLTYIALMNLPISPFIMLSSMAIEGTEWMENAANLNWTILGCVLFYQSVIVAFSHIIWQRLMSTYAMSEVVPWTLLIPVFGVASAALLLHEPITATIVIGGGLTIAGVGIITVRKIQKKQTA